MPKQKINIKERFSDGEIDLSMSELSDVPVKEIAQIKKASHLDLSNNNLTTLPKNFSILTHITKLDLSKNQLNELPEDFGNLVKLTYLDLYRNQLQHLPLSFHNLKALRWLDLKDNPLVPAVANVAGPCLDAKQCQECAKNIVKFFSDLQVQINSEIEQRNQKQKQIEIKQQQVKAKKEEKKKKQKQANGLNVKNNEKVIIEEKTKLESVKHKPKQKSLHLSLLTKIQLVFSLFFCVFILTSVHCKWTKIIEDMAVTLYGKTLEWMPDNYKPYGFQAGNFIQKIHEKTGNITMGTLEKYSSYFHTLKPSLNLFIDKIKDFFANILNKQ